MNQAEMDWPMELLEIVYRASPPEPWSEGEKIPWNDPAFSERMLREHLTQEHDAASRRSPLIDQHVGWIYGCLLGGKPARILDLGCGPGLYATRLARLGSECVGIDFGPASVEHARKLAAAEGLPCIYRLEDIRTADYVQGYNLAMLIYGEFNVFSPADAAQILGKVHAALDPGGILLLEPHTFAAVEELAGKSHWYSADGGLFSARPHLCLCESFWEAASRTTTERYYVVDAESGGVVRHSATMQAYTVEAYRETLEACGFEEVAFYPSLTGVDDESQPYLCVVIARRP
jgi:SAM-dependent methyltransferase